MLRGMPNRKVSGLTLIELMIAMFISVIVIAAFITAFVTLIRGSRDSIALARLDSQLSHVLSVMTLDLQRAGYWGNSTSSANNPFMVTGSTDITVNGLNNCVLFTYDSDGDGALPAISAAYDDERYGFRLINSVIQSRPSGAVFSCSAASSNWEDLTDINVVTVTDFSVTLNVESVDIDGDGAGTSQMSVRSVNVTITGQLTQDSSVSKTMTKTIRVYNDKYTP